MNRIGLAIAVGFLMLCALEWSYERPPAPPPHAGEFSWAIQGVYSQLDCGNQPGKRPDYEYVDTVDADGASQRLVFFLGCR